MKERTTTRALWGHVPNLINHFPFLSVCHYFTLTDYIHKILKLSLPTLFSLNLHSLAASMRQKVERISWYHVVNLMSLILTLHPPFIQRLLSEVEVSVSMEDKAVGRYSVSVSPLCPDGSTAKGQSCSGVQRNQTVNTHAYLQYHDIKGNVIINEI